MYPPINNLEPKIASLMKKERYEEHKTKIFLIVKGQCTLNMQNKVESLKGYNLIEASGDVIKLLNRLKELTFKTHEVQYGYWTICQTVRRDLTMRQQDNEPLVAEYYKRFTSCVDVAESQWGTPRGTVQFSWLCSNLHCVRRQVRFLTCVSVSQYNEMLRRFAWHADAQLSPPLCCGVF